MEWFKIWDIISSVLPIFLGVILGGFFRKKNFVSAASDSSMMWLLINLLMPCLILNAILKNKALERPDNLIFSPLVGFSTIVLGLIVSYFVAKMLKINSKAEERTFIVCTAVYNYGYLPLPLAIHLYDMETAGVLFVHNIGVEIALWSIALMVLKGTGTIQGIRKILNAPLIATILAVILNCSQFDNWIPGFIYRTIHLFGQAAIPVAILLVGAAIADHMEPFSASRAGMSIISSAVAIRLIFLPAMFIFIGYILPCSTELKRVIGLQAAMPAGLLTIIMAKQYGGAPSIALKVIVGTSVIGLITLPIWIQVGQAMAKTS